MLKLYFSPGACSLSPHITLREAGLAFELEQVDLRQKLTKTGADFTVINPKGYVPALRLNDGQVLTEGVVIVQYLADQRPELGLAPPAGSMERYRLQEWLNFIATELHKGMSPLYNAKATEELKVSIRERLNKRFGILAKHLDKNPFVMGERFTVADPYALYTLRSWVKNGPRDLSELPSLKSFVDRMMARPAVQRALEAEAQPS